MRAMSAAWARLVDDAAMFPPGNAGPVEAVAAHRQYRASWFGDVIGPLVVSDQKLAEVGRAATDEPIAVSVVNTSGAGGLVSLAGRAVEGVAVVSVESALRDLDDLAGNAARVVAAASELDDEVAVFVELPYVAGWERAVAVVEEAGLYAKLRTGGESGIPPAEQLAQQLSVLVEADVPFKATAGLHHAWASGGTPATGPGEHGFLQLMAAVEALVDGADVSDAAELLRPRDDQTIAAQIGGWNDAQAARVRRRLRSFGCCGVLDPLGELVELGLLAAPA